jgi:hypothetical protein
MASATWHTFRPKNRVTRGFMPKLGSLWCAIKVQALYDLADTTELPLDRSLDTPYTMLRHADITGCALADRWAKGREDSGVLLRGSRGQRSDLRRGWSGKFAGILQGKIRQRVSQLRMLMTVACEGNMRAPLARTPGHNGQAKPHRRCCLPHRRDLRVAYGGISQRRLGWPTR